MCGPKPPRDNSAEVARQQEQERQDRINAGKAKIDQSFSIFTPDYFDQFKTDYLNNYNPQVDEQFEDARKGLRYNLARAGTQDSTAGQKAFGDLTEDYGDRRREIASKALEATNNIRSQVEQNKSELYSQNVAAADPSLAAITAAGRAGSLQSPPSFSPLADLFAGATNAGAAYYYGQQKGLPEAYRNSFKSGLPSGSGYVVR
jgi:hypothetical protein